MNTNTETKHTPETLHFNEDIADTSFYCYPDVDIKIEIVTTGNKEGSYEAFEKGRKYKNKIETAVNEYPTLIEEIKALKESNRELVDCFIKANKYIEHQAGGVPAYLQFGSEAILKATGENTSEVEYFKQGQLLLPDYVNADTMVVINAMGLNIAIAPIEPGFDTTFITDEDFADLFSEFTIPLVDYRGAEEFWNEYYKQ